MTDEYKLIETLVVHLFLAQSLDMEEESPSPASIRELIDKCRIIPGFTSISEEDAQELASRLEERFRVRTSVGSVIGMPFSPWLPQTQSRADFTPYYWKRHREFVMGQKFSNADLIKALDEDTDNILGRLGNPDESGTWDRRGLVLGHVQSGKTENYTSLICKAADAGYKVIIVVAGTHNSVRNQTQARIDEGFVGTDSSRMFGRGGYSMIGVGKIDGQRRPGTLTSVLRDFNKVTATAAGLNIK